MTSPTYDPYNVPPPRIPRPPWWRRRPALYVWALSVLAIEFWVAKLYLESVS